MPPNDPQCQPPTLFRKVCLIDLRPKKHVASGFLTTKSINELDSLCFDHSCPSCLLLEKTDHFCHQTTILITPGRFFFFGNGLPPPWGQDPNASPQCPESLSRYWKDVPTSSSTWTMKTLPETNIFAPEDRGNPKRKRSYSKHPC